MRIEVKGRNLPVTDELREHVEKRFQKVAKQVTELAVLEIEVSKERNPANPESRWPRRRCYLKGVTLRAKDASPRPQALGQPGRRRARPPGQAPPRQAPQAPRAARRRGSPQLPPEARRAVAAGDLTMSAGAKARPGPRTLEVMTILDRALRMGEAKQFKQYAKRVDRINAWEPELELLEDDELREQVDEPARARPQRRVARRPAARDVRARARGPRRARWACATSTSR